MGRNLLENKAVFYIGNPSIIAGTWKNMPSKTKMNAIQSAFSDLKNAQNHNPTLLTLAHQCRSMISVCVLASATTHGIGPGG